MDALHSVQDRPLGAHAEFIHHRRPHFFILKPRDNNCPISLWVAERIAERRLLNYDGIEMFEDTWLELLLAFVTNEEKQTLQVPVKEQRAAFADGAGYDVLLLQRSLNRFDPSTFRKFQQSHCHDPVALQLPDPTQIEDGSGVTCCDQAGTDLSNQRGRILL
jgi:hypothetical protein